MSISGPCWLGFWLGWPWIIDQFGRNWHIKKMNLPGVPVMAQWLTSPTRNHGVVGSIPGLARWVGIRRCHGLWCRLLMQLGSPYCCGCGVGRQRLQLRFDPWPGNLHMPRERPKKWQKEKKKKKKQQCPNEESQRAHHSFPTSNV